MTLGIVAAVGLVELMMVGLGGVAILIVLALVIMQVRQSGQKKEALRQAEVKAQIKPKPAASINMKTNWLEGVEGGVRDKTYHIGAREATIGRKVGNYIQIIDDNVSRVHVKVIGNAQGVSVIDQNSNIGTRVNDTPLTGGVAHLLKDGDRLQIGQNVMVFHAQANFGTNHGLTDAKIAGQAQIKKTEAMGALNWKQEVADALVKAGGDKAKAAEIMGVPVEVYERMLEQAGS